MNTKIVNIPQNRCLPFIGRVSYIKEYIYDEVDEKHMRIVIYGS